MNIASVHYVSTNKEYSAVQIAETTFVCVFFSEENEGAHVFCHNFKGYDSYPFVSYLYEIAILPEVIMNGSKFMSFEIPHLKMKFLDSMNYIPLALSKMPKAFDIPEVAKGYFPHLNESERKSNAIMNHLQDI